MLCKMAIGRGEVVPADFSEDEIDRRAKEIMRRCCGQPPTFNLETGQPYEGEPLSHEELKRRGY